MGFAFPFREWFADSSFIKDQLYNGNKPGEKNYDQFLKGDLHWSQLLSLLIINKRAVA
jgi:hypothetical protein